MGVGKRKLRSGAIDWYYSVSAGKDENGNRLRLFKAGFRRKSDAEAAELRVRQELEDGAVIRPDPRTFGAFFEEWLREHAEKNCEPKTVERYRELAAYVLPHVGKLQLREVSTRVLERLYNRLRQEGGKRKGKKNGGAAAPLSPKTVRNIAGVVHSAFTTALRWKLLRVNPATACQLPKLEHHEAKALDIDGTIKYLEAARGHWLYPILAVAVATGCRRGELLALTWKDVDLVKGSMIVSKSLEQTKAGLRLKPPKNGIARSMPLPAVAVQALAAHQAGQEKMRRVFGKDYRTDPHLVFARFDGEYLKPDSVTAAACLLARNAGLKGVGLHTLRHSHGSQMLSAGVPLPAASKRLGHSSTKITSEVYIHAFTQDEIDAATRWNEKMKAAFPAAKPREKKLASRSGCKRLHKTASATRN